MSNSGGCSVTRIENLSILRLSNPPINAINQGIRRAIVSELSSAARDTQVDAIVMLCEGKTFFVGADVREFGQPQHDPQLPDVVAAIEQCPKPVIAAMHGSALGGGLEIAMASHYRVAAPGTQLGLPEVKLGLLPGARGTQYLPRLVGVRRALELIASGQSISAKQAFAEGLIDEIAKTDLLCAAMAAAKRIAGSPPRRTSELPIELSEPEVFEAFARENGRKFAGREAPSAIIKSVRAATELPISEAIRVERDCFLSLRDGPQHAALKYVFFAERAAAKLPGLDRVKPAPTKNVGVIGAGTMGSGIAVALLSAGLSVTVFEQDTGALERGRVRIQEMLLAGARSGRLEDETTESASSRLFFTLDISDLAQADLVVEAAWETLEVKTAIFSQLDKVVGPDSIFATNTSYLDVDAIAAATSRPEKVVGLHFFSPANIMRLLEIVRGAQTDLRTLATALALARKIGKIPVVSGNCHGFIGNRMLAVRRREAEAMVVAGARPEQVDMVLENFGFPMGPFRTADLAGLDLGWSVETSTGSTLRERLCEAGRRGQKVLKGYYDYHDNRRGTPSAESQAIIEEFAQSTGIPRRDFDDAEILDRLVWPMVDEGARLLAEGVAQRESDIDVVWVHGYGWPAWKGGPMYYASRTGFSEICRKLCSLGMEPSAALRGLV